MDIKRIAVFTSGGDAPGMNAVVRAVVRAGAYYDLHTYGIMNGYEGLIDGKIKRLEKGDVANILHRGGTILKTARSERFRTKAGRKLAYESLKANDIDAVIAIGGNGTFTGAKIFEEEFGFPFIGIPGTIDNDLYGTDFTIGFDTAINTAIEAVDKIRDTADSHNRLFFIEVMGRHSGYIALHTAIGSGAGSVVIPEAPTDVTRMVEQLDIAKRRGKLFALIIVAEGGYKGGAMKLADKIKSLTSEYETKVTIIGHLQRGGNPTCMDRVLASTLGFEAVKAAMEGKRNVQIGQVDGEIVLTSFDEAITKSKKPDEQMMEMARILSL